MLLIAIRRREHSVGQATLGNQDSANFHFLLRVALGRATGGRTIVSVVLVAALVSLAKVFNGSFIAATRLLYALGRRNLVHRSFATVHPVNQTPITAIATIGAITAGGIFLSDVILVPVTEVGSIASAFGWMMACAAYYRMNALSASRLNTPAHQMGLNPRRERLIATFGVGVAGLMILMKLIPSMPGHFTVHEYASLALWLLLGIAIRKRPTSPGVVNR